MKMNVKGNDNFRTPNKLFNQLNSIFNFTLDVACTTNDCKCLRGIYYDKGFNSLEYDWKGERCFCNPPFSKKKEFIEKADYEVQIGGCPVVVMVLPSNCMDSAVFQKVIKKKYFYEVLSGRVAFIHPETGLPMKGNNSGTVIVYFKKDIER